MSEERLRVLQSRFRDGDLPQSTGMKDSRPEGTLAVGFTDF